MFTYSGYTFVALDERVFESEDVGTAPAVSTWVTYILPASAMSYYMPLVMMMDAFKYGGVEAISSQVIAEAMFVANSGDGITNDSNQFEALKSAIVNSDSDPLILRYLGAPMSSIYYSANFDFSDLDPSTNASSKGTSFESFAMIGGVRARPHFIQKYRIAKNFSALPFSAPAAATAAGRK
jgi:hypothetical protein